MQIRYYFPSYQLLVTVPADKIDDKCSYEAIYLKPGEATLRGWVVGHGSCVVANWPMMRRRILTD